MGKPHFERLYTALSPGSANKIKKHFPQQRDRNNAQENEPGHLSVEQLELLLRLRNRHVTMTYQGHHKRFINDFYGECNEVTAGHFSVQFIRKACIASCKDHQKSACI